MGKFSKWSEMTEATASQPALFNYLNHIDMQAHPNLEDIKTLINMTKKNQNQYFTALFRDMYPTLEKISMKLSPVERADFHHFLGNLNIPEPRFDRFLISRGIHRQTEAPYTFVAPHILQNEIENEMAKDNPDMEYVLKIIDNNKKLFSQLDDSLKKQAIDWIEEEVSKTQGRDLSAMFKKMFKNEDPDA